MCLVRYDTKSYTAEFKKRFNTDEGSRGLLGNNFDTDNLQPMEFNTTSWKPDSRNSIPLQPLTSMTRYRPARACTTQHWASLTAPLRYSSSDK